MKEGVWVVESGEAGYLRRFGLTVGPAFLIATAFFAWRGVYWASAALGVSGAMILLGAWARPQALRPLERVWVGIGGALSTFNTWFLIAATFLFLVAPLGLILRLGRRDPLGLRRNAGHASYFEPRRDQKFPPVSFERQF